ncbi:hypothetical protein LOZ53_003440 [Ophidiomyces ophidiicola]|uniref:uncharacterized protein n=1 Tax=Ophidiomyces ophidiicola TaxID=1387563 RepID=UPI0020C46F97|nr:uncharacterized protein LOZ57_002365 [Ophidiomyces ophidiicola]KAI1913414.1 hypothetical protein LOZ61_002746 [Ophidiomyces ophidiicola]KAI1919631.1 hypothetical protein LOZ64_002138 [Ophidiomyces ophidiicola]KAI1927137.1 hypothetical protein LOZ60_003289 [Ophidiomyces ophidiicola]KAI1949886.1 hypothetical protein LOZ57_002365 [Ophidiomyces ophidiicola]KAI1977900.1 hypothetical protein LOZ55_003128 [Ophidiomyces ophidiicola]
MGVTKKILKTGNGVDKPSKGDEIHMEYRGCLYDSTNPSGHFMGTKFDSTEDRGEFRTKIGVGAVIRGWDEAVVQMSLGEKSILTITDDYAYGSRGFPGVIPPNATLVL